MSGLYGHERLSAVIAAIDEAVSAAGLCFAKTLLGEIALSSLPHREQSPSAVTPSVDEDAFTRQLNASARHQLFQHRTELGILLCCNCYRCTDRHTDKHVCPGLWHSYNAQVEEVTVHLLTERTADYVLPTQLTSVQFAKEVQAIKTAIRGGAAARIVAHDFDFRDRRGFPSAMVAVSNAEGSLSQRLPSLDESERFQTAQALLREVTVLEDLGIVHSGCITPDSIMLDRSSGERTVSILPVPCDTHRYTALWVPPNRMLEAATRQDNRWSVALVLMDLLASSNVEAAHPDGAASSPEPIPVFYRLRQAHTTWDVTLTHSQWLDAEEASGRGTASEDLVPPGVNPWLKAVVVQLLAGKPYRGLMTLEPAEFRDTVTRLTDERADGNWRLLRDALSAAEVLRAEGGPEAVLRYLREEVVEHRLPMSGLYGHERLSAVIAAMDEAVSAAGLCFAKNSLGDVQLVEGFDDDFKC